jgi:DNA-binding IclR family transcriptional regulator
VQRDARTAHYSLGAELLRWAHLIMARAPLREIALVRMRELVAECNETVFLGVYEASRREMMFAACVESDHPLRYTIELSRWIPMNTGASSLAILAWLGDKELELIMARALGGKPPSADSLVSRARLSSELQAIRRKGYAFSRAKRLAGAIGIGAPIFASDGNVIGDLVLTIPEQRFERKASAKLARLLVKHAAAITADIGGRAPDLHR